MKRICFRLAIILLACWSCNSDPEQEHETKVIERGRKTVHPQHFKLQSGGPSDSAAVYTAANIIIKVENGEDSMQTITISNPQKRLINYIRKIDTLPSPYLYIYDNDTILGLYAAGKFTAYRIANSKALLFDHFFTHKVPELQARDSVLEFMHPAK
ncbi:MAG: hypothetical protein JO154_24840 [Chitinophaga sp.]|uniref:hypothetical protein n=1 Tax=Chitinophaga sp. TaxID=1869181 RepID=UPI0025C6E007|nr:hypothetical protein [Chitinophaga sp.]MBV8255846.1 hypothetical protein [Chitinophaga sp.]